MDQQAIGPAWVAMPIVAAFAINMFAEWLLLSSERRFYVALGKSLKAIIIPGTDSDLRTDHRQRDCRAECVRGGFQTRPY